MIIMLTQEEADRLYLKRIDSESWHGPYTEEEIRLQKERNKKIEEYMKRMQEEEEAEQK